jgi:hypothetical protein
MKKRTVELKTEPRMATAPQDAAWDFVDIPGAAALVCVSKATIRRHLTLKKLTRFKFASRTLIRKSELLEQIQKAK